MEGGGNQESRWAGVLLCELKEKKNGRMKICKLSIGRAAAWKPTK